jgi:hypothetical protein
MEQIDHRADCQLITVETYGLCTCDFDARKRQQDRDRIRDEDLARMDAIKTEHGEDHRLFWLAMEFATLRLAAFDLRHPPIRA